MCCVCTILAADAVAAVPKKPPLALPPIPALPPNRGWGKGRRRRQRQDKEEEAGPLDRQSLIAITQGVGWAGSVAEVAALWEAELLKGGQDGEFDPVVVVWCAGARVR